jgi:hypothetical protein
MRQVAPRVALSALVLSVGCSGSPEAPSAVPAQPVIRYAGGSVAVTAGSGRGVSAQALEGNFRTKPAPNANGVIVVGAGEKLIVNANDERAANPGETLTLIVNWGDGPNDRVPCGPCRLEHAYRAGGLYDMEASIDNGKGTTASRRYRVEVRGSLSLFEAQPSVIPPGDSTTLVWNVLDATSVTIDNGLGPVQPADSAVVSPAATTTYTLRASAPSGPETLRADVKVTWISAFFFDPATIAVGETSNLTLGLFPGFVTGFLDSCANASITGALPSPGGVIFQVTAIAPGTCDMTLTITDGVTTSVETARLIVQ